jgi:hypothetical protein
MNALSPDNLLADAFACSGSVRPDSAPWKAQAIGNLEARLALAWYNARKAERIGPKDGATIAKNDQMAEHNAIVLERINGPTVFADIRDALDDVDQVRRALVRLRRLGSVTTVAQRIDGVRQNVYSRAEAMTPEAITRQSAAIEASRKAKAGQRRAIEATVERLHAQGLTNKQIAAKLHRGAGHIAAIVLRLGLAFNREAKE